MAKYTVLKVKDVENSFAKRGWPGAMHFLKKPLEAEQVALSYRQMPQHFGGKGGYGHRHKTQEEVVYVIKGKLQVKVDDDIVELGPNEMIRIAAGTTQALWNDYPEEVELLIISNHVGSMKEEVEFTQDFWPANQG